MEHHESNRNNTDTSSPGWGNGKKAAAQQETQGESRSLRLKEAHRLALHQQAPLSSRAKETDYEQQDVCPTSDYSPSNRSLSGEGYGSDLSIISESDVGSMATHQYDDDNSSTCWPDGRLISTTKANQTSNKNQDRSEFDFLDDTMAALSSMKLEPTLSSDGESTSSSVFRDERKRTTCVGQQHHHYQQRQQEKHESIRAMPRPTAGEYLMNEDRHVDAVRAGLTMLISCVILVLGFCYWNFHYDGMVVILKLWGIAILCYLSTIPLGHHQSSPARQEMQTKHGDSVQTGGQQTPTSSFLRNLLCSRKSVLLVTYILSWSILCDMFWAMWAASWSLTMVDTVNNNSGEVSSGTRPEQIAHPGGLESGGEKGQPVLVSGSQLNTSIRVRNEVDFSQTPLSADVTPGMEFSAPMGEGNPQQSQVGSKEPQIHEDTENTIPQGDAMVEEGGSKTPDITETTSLEQTGSEDAHQVENCAEEVATKSIGLLLRRTFSVGELVKPGNKLSSGKQRWKRARAKFAKQGFEESHVAIQHERSANLFVNVWNGVKNWKYRIGKTVEMAMSAVKRVLEEMVAFLLGLGTKSSRNQWMVDVIAETWTGDRL